MVKALNLGRDPAQHIPAVVGMVFLAGAALLAATPAHAGRSCESRKPVPPQVIERGMKLAEQTSAALDAEYAKSGVQVVALARAGQDLSKYGLRYSHMGWAYKTPEGPWRVAHKLNECGTAVGHLYRQGLPRSEGTVPLSVARSAQRKGAEGRGSARACARLDGLNSCGLGRPAPGGIAAHGDVRHGHRRSLCSNARPMALGTKAMASPAADRITPVPITLQVTTVPTA